MAYCACKCLNVTLECETLEVADIGRLDLSLMEQRDIFFSEKLVSCSASSLKSYIVQPALIGQHIVGRYTIQSCVVCGQKTHVVIHDKNITLIAASLHTTLEHINNFKKSENFSPAFNLLVPEVSNDVEMKENIDTNNQLIIDKNGCSPSSQVIGTLRKQLNQTLQLQLENIEEAVRQFKEQKYEEYESYRARAQRDHEILSSKARNNIDKDVRANNTTLDNGPPSPFLPPLQRRRLSSIKDDKKFIKNDKPIAEISHEEDSLDAEDIFEVGFRLDSRNYMASDQDDYDSDDGSNDEGIHIGRPRGHPIVDIARSLPITMPKFPQENTSSRDIDDYEEETQDIAASIKALARSVHGDVFELPRPRFSTQI